MASEKSEVQSGGSEEQHLNTDSIIPQQDNDIQEADATKDTPLSQSQTEVEQVNLQATPLAGEAGQELTTTTSGGPLSPPEGNSEVVLTPFSAEETGGEPVTEERTVNTEHELSKAEQKEAVDNCDNEFDTIAFREEKEAPTPTYPSTTPELASGQSEWYKGYFPDTRLETETHQVSSGGSGEPSNSDAETVRSSLQSKSTDFENHPPAANTTQTSNESIYAAHFLRYKNLTKLQIGLIAIGTIIFILGSIIAGSFLGPKIWSGFDTVFSQAVQHIVNQALNFTKAFVVSANYKLVSAHDWARATFSDAGLYGMMTGLVLLATIGIAVGLTLHEKHRTKKQLKLKTPPKPDNLPKRWLKKFKNFFSRQDEETLSTDAHREPSNINDIANSATSTSQSSILTAIADATKSLFCCPRDKARAQSYIFDDEAANALLPKKEVVDRKEGSIDNDLNSSCLDNVKASLFSCCGSRKSSQVTSTREPDWNPDQKDGSEENYSYEEYSPN